MVGRLSAVVVVAVAVAIAAAATAAAVATRVVVFESGPFVHAVEVRLT